MAGEDGQDRSGFFVDRGFCSACGCCHAEAPENFSWINESDSTVSSVIHKQPENETELAEVIEALCSICPFDSICYGGRDETVIARLLEKGASPEVIVTLNKKAHSQGS